MFYIINIEKYVKISYKTLLFGVEVTVKLLFIIIIFLTLSCKGKTVDFKAEIETSFNSKNYEKMLTYLDKYKIEYGRDYYFEKYSILRYLTLNQFEKALKEYTNSKVIELKNDYELADKIADYFLETIKNDKIQDKLDKITYFIQITPNSKKILIARINLLLNDTSKINDVLKEYIKFEELFKEDKNILKKTVFGYLSKFYEKDFNLSMLETILNLNIDESQNLIKELLQKTPYKLVDLNITTNINNEILKPFLTHEDYYLQKWTLKNWIKSIKNHPDNEILNIYKTANDKLKLFIYYEYYKTHKIEIDSDLLKSFLESENPTLTNVAVDVIDEFNFNQFNNLLTEIFTKDNCWLATCKIKILKSFAKNNKEEGKKLISSLTADDLDTQIIIEEIKLLYKININEQFVEKVLKEGVDYLKSRLLTMMLSNNIKIPKYFTENYSNFLYYYAFTEAPQYLDKEFLEKIALYGYKTFGNYKALSLYFDKLTETELLQFAHSTDFKTKNEDIKENGVNLLAYSKLLKINKAKYFDEFNKSLSWFQTKQQIDLFEFDLSYKNWIIEQILKASKEDIKKHLLLKLGKILTE